MKVDEAMMERIPQGSGSVIPPRDGSYTSGKIRYLLNRKNPVGRVIVRCIHVLSRGANHQLRPLDTKEVLHALIRFAYFPRLGPQALGPEETAHLFRQATTLAGKLEGNQLVVQNAIDALGTLPEFLREEAVHALRATG
jgi:hypothetical protein